MPLYVRESYFEKTINTWDLSKRDLPPRSKLFPVQPFNINTIDVESFFSYLARMAFEYSVSIYDLIKYGVSNTVLSTKPILPSSLSEKINSKGIVVERLIDTFQELTQRTDIYFTTLLGLQEKICLNNVIKKVRAWCSYCFSDQIKFEGQNYEKLAWALQPVKYCQQHKVLLENKCSSCKKTLRAYSAFFRPGFCSNCFKWLGSKKYSKKSDDYTGLNVLSEEKFAYADFEEIIIQSNILRIGYGKSRFPKNLSDCITFFTQGNIVKFSHILSVSLNEISQLVIGEILPTWNFLIKLSYVVQISILDILTAHELKLSKRN